MEIEVSIKEMFPKKINALTLVWSVYGPDLPAVSTDSFIPVCSSDPAVSSMPRAARQLPALCTSEHACLLVEARSEGHTVARVSPTQHNHSAAQWADMTRAPTEHRCCQVNEDGVLFPNSPKCL